MSNSEEKNLLAVIRRLETQWVDPVVDRGSKYLKLAGIISGAVYTLSWLAVTLVTSLGQSVWPLVVAVPAFISTVCLSKYSNPWSTTVYMFAVIVPACGVGASVVGLLVVDASQESIGIFALWVEVLILWLSCQSVSIPILVSRMAVEMLRSSQALTKATTESLVAVSQLARDHEHRIQSLESPHPPGACV